MPVKPPIVMGALHKMNNYFVNLKERFFVINPDEGTLIRYQSKNDFPLKPIEVIPL